MKLHRRPRRGGWRPWVIVAAPLAAGFVAAGLLAADPLVGTAPASKRVFVDNLTGALQVVARDTKVQVEFNPEVVKSWRLLGYENRDVADEDFRNDTVDGGEVGAGGRSQIATGTFDPEDVNFFLGQGIDHDDFGGGVAAARVGDALIVAQDVGTVAQPFHRIELAGDSVVPVVVYVFENFM